MEYYLTIRCRVLNQKEYLAMKIENKLKNRRNKDAF